MGIFSYMQTQSQSTQSIDSQVINRIRGHGRGYVFVPGDFLDLGSRTAVDLVLHRLTQKGVIRWLARGVYDFPKQHPVLGMLWPSADDVAQALAGRDRTRLQPAGAYAANMLGLSEQVPAKAVYLTDGPSRVVTIGSMTIQLRRTTPRNMAAAGRLSGLLIQALREVGQPHMTPERIVHLKRTLPADERRGLLKDLKLAPPGCTRFCANWRRPNREIEFPQSHDGRASAAGQSLYHFSFTWRSISRSTSIRYSNAGGSPKIISLILS